ncbi:hypothetical protein EVAR_96432_1 [Eumeta japonica]|uniref:Uncharacterized protein n=1 Tax=Eumeta variegata TaxID=151549 RepID=A0A4C2AB00_EUMVA|nr:hypothetical protein EVAR_96432_1 [Eumeta japonica]
MEYDPSPCILTKHAFPSSTLGPGLLFVPLSNPIFSLGVCGDLNREGSKCRVRRCLSLLGHRPTDGREIARSALCSPRSQGGTRQ